MKNKDIMIEKYLQYASTDEAFAVLFVKKYLKAAKGKWIHIVEIHDSHYFEASNLEFRAVLCELFDRKMRPSYPNRADYENEWLYRQAVRAITWETAHRDIEKQQNSGIKGTRYIIEGVKYPLKQNFFREDAPPEIKTLERNLSDRTSPLWDVAIKYVRPKKWGFRIKRIRKTKQEWLDF